MEDKRKLFSLDNDLMFSSVMSNEDACINLLQAIFPDKEIDRVEYLSDFNPRSKNFELEIQKYIQPNPSGKSIRLDVYFKNSDTIYNVEMERTNRGRFHTIRRARMYSSLIDVNLMTRGMEFHNLIESYVIFLCEFDPFDRDRYIYKFSSMCEEEDLCENNGRYNIYLNTKGSKGNINSDLEELFKYINGGTSAIGMETNSTVVKTIDGYVKEFNSNDTWRKGAMTLDMLIRENFDQGKDEGFTEGFNEGFAEGNAKGFAEGITKGIAEAEAKAKEEKACTIRELYAKKIPLKTIAECTNLSLAEVNEIISAT